MIGKFDLNRHFVVFLSVVVLVLAGLSILTNWLTPQEPDENKYEPTPDRSVFNTKPSGYQYWYQTIQLLQKNHQLPLPIRLWRDNFTMLATLPDASTMVLIEPIYSSETGTPYPSESSSQFSTSNITKLLTWVAQGNTLIYIDQLSRPHAHVLMSRLGFHTIKNKSKPTTSSVPKTSPKPLSALKKSIQSLEEIPVLFPDNTDTRQTLQAYLTHPAFVKPIGVWGQTSAELTQKEHPPQVLLKTKQTSILMKIPYGKGEVWLGSTPELAQNSYLKQKTWDNYQLFTNILLSTGKPVYINEFIHSQPTQQNGFFNYYYQKTPLGRIGVQLLVVFLFLLWWSYTNWQPKQTPTLEADAPISLQAFVNSLSSLYQKTDAAPLALKPYWQMVSQHLEKRCHIHLLPERPPEEIEHILSRHLLGIDGLLNTLGYSEEEKQHVIDHLVNTYQVIEQSKTGKKAHYCTENELRKWAQTMVTLLQKMETRHKRFALK